MRGKPVTAGLMRCCRRRDDIDFKSVSNSSRRIDKLLVVYILILAQHPERLMPAELHWENMDFVRKAVTIPSEAQWLISLGLVAWCAALLECR